MSFLKHARLFRNALAHEKPYIFENGNMLMEDKDRKKSLFEL